MLNDFDFNVFADVPALTLLNLNDNNLTLTKSEFPMLPNLIEL